MNDGEKEGGREAKGERGIDRQLLSLSSSPVTGRQVQSTDR